MIECPSMNSSADQQGDSTGTKLVASEASNKTKQDKENQANQEATKNCYECNRSLAESPQLINIAGQAHRWHPECFRCQICREPMDRETSCHLYKNKILCRNDYVRLQRDHLVSCAKCKWPVGPSDWIRKAGSLVYHLACFNCDICMRQLNTGEQFAINIQEQDQVVRLLCRLHFTIEQNLGIGDSNCVQDSNTSRQQLAGESNGRQQLIGGHLNRLANHQRLDELATMSSGAGGSCRKASAMGVDYVSGHSRPHQRVVNQKSGRESSAYVSQNRFNSTASSSSLSTTMANTTTSATLASKLMLQHSATSFSGLLTPPIGASSSTDPLARELSKSNKSIMIGHEDLAAIMSSSKTTKHHSQHNQHHCASTSSISSNGSSSSGQVSLMGANNGNACLVGGNATMSNSSSGSGSLPSKSKRVRTTFTEDQLSILQNHFHIDSNPDGQDLERIATITGLSKRVTQVWFQNSRARQKKYLIKRKPGSSGGGGGGGGGGATTNLIISAASINLPPPSTTTTTTSTTISSSPLRLSDCAANGAASLSRPQLQQQQQTQHLGLAEGSNIQHQLNLADGGYHVQKESTSRCNQVLLGLSSDNGSSRNSDFRRNDDERQQREEEEAEDDIEEGDIGDDYDITSSDDENEESSRAEQIISEDGLTKQLTRIKE